MGGIPLEPLSEYGLKPSNNVGHISHLIQQGRYRLDKILIFKLWFCLLSYSLCLTFLLLAAVSKIV